MAKTNQSFVYPERLINRHKTYYYHVICFVAIAFFAISCGDADIEINNIRINHYKQVAVGVIPTLVLIVQEGGNVESGE